MHVPLFLRMQNHQSQLQKSWLGEFFSDLFSRVRFSFLPPMLAHELKGLEKRCLGGPEKVSDIPMKNSLVNIYVVISVDYHLTDIIT